jgi:hypothetical protein
MEEGVIVKSASYMKIKNRTKYITCFLVITVFFTGAPKAEAWDNVEDMFDGGGSGGSGDTFSTGTNDDYVSGGGTNSGGNNDDDDNGGGGGQVGEIRLDQVTPPTRDDPGSAGTGDFIGVSDGSGGVIFVPYVAPTPNNDDDDNNNTPTTTNVPPVKSVIPTVTIEARTPSQANNSWRDISLLEVDYGERVDVRWRSTDAALCNGRNIPTPTFNEKEGTIQDVNLTAGGSTVFSVLCGGANGPGSTTAEDSVVVTANAYANLLPQNLRVTSGPLNESTGTYDQVIVDVEIHNNGDISVYRSKFNRQTRDPRTSIILTAADGTVHTSGDRVSDGLAKNEQESNQANFSGVEPGNYTVRVEVDVANEINESNESDNVLVKTGVLRAVAILPPEELPLSGVAADLQYRIEGSSNWSTGARVTVERNTNVDLRWTSTGTERCTGYNFSTGMGSPVAGEVLGVNIPATNDKYINHTVTCSALDGTEASDSVQIRLPAPVPPEYNLSLQARTHPSSPSFSNAERSPVRLAPSDTLDLKWNVFGPRRWEAGGSYVQLGSCEGTNFSTGTSSPTFGQTLDVAIPPFGEERLYTVNCTILDPHGKEILLRKTAKVVNGEPRMSLSVRTGSNPAWRNERGTTEITVNLGEQVDLLANAVGTHRSGCTMNADRHGYNTTDYPWEFRYDKLEFGRYPFPVYNWKPTSATFLDINVPILSSYYLINPDRVPSGAVTPFSDSDEVTYTMECWLKDQDNRNIRVSDAVKIVVGNSPSPPSESSAPGATITASDCMISAGNEGCIGTISWTSSNTDSSRRLISSPAGFYSSQTSKNNQLVQLGFGDTTFRFTQDSGELASATARATCEVGTSWDTSDGRCLGIPAGPLTITLNPSLVRKGNTTVISWDTGVHPATNCTITGSSLPDGFTLTTQTGSVETLPITGPHRYTLSCGPSPEANQFVDVRVLPTIYES